MFSKQVKIHSFIFFTIIGSLIFFVTACGSSSPEAAGTHHGTKFGPQPPTGDNSSNPSPQPAGSYPAPHAPMPQMLSQGGGVLSHPQFKAISFPSTQDVSSIEKFLSVFGPSQEWTAMVSEYGVGSAIATTPVHLTEEAPPQIDDNQIQNWLAEQFNDPNLPLGSLDSNTIYIIYFPEGTNVTAGGAKSCVDFDGYHSAFQIPNSETRIFYAIIPRCQNFTIDEITETTSHELVEASEDPDVGKGYNKLSADFSIWETLSYGAEGGDLCQNYETSSYKPSDLGFQIQRTWSNQAAAAGKDPCVPTTDSEVYFNASPQVSDTVNYSINNQTKSSKGIYIPVGQTKTVALDLYSAGPTSAWSLSYYEPEKVNNLNIQFSQSSGVNGDKIQMTITVNSQNQQFGAEPFWIVSTLNGVSHYWPVLVGN